MEEIKAFKLSDGRIIDNEIKAKELQNEIDIKQKLSEICDKWFVDLEYYEMAEQIFILKGDFLSALNIGNNVSNEEAIYAMLHEFRNWNKDWDTFMAKKPQNADDFVKHLSKLFKVERLSANGS